MENQQLSPRATAQSMMYLYNPLGTLYGILFPLRCYLTVVSVDVVPNMVPNLNALVWN